jgi:hypothetical protein
MFYLLELIEPKIKIAHLMIATDLSNIHNVTRSDTYNLRKLAYDINSS